MLCPHTAMKTCDSNWEANGQNLWDDFAFEGHQETGQKYGFRPKTADSPSLFGAVTFMLLMFFASLNCDKTTSRRGERGKTVPLLTLDRNRPTSAGCSWPLWSKVAGFLYLKSKLVTPLPLRQKFAERAHASMLKVDTKKKKSHKSIKWQMKGPRFLSFLTESN